MSALAGLKNGVMFQLSSPITVMIFCSFAAAAICIGCSWGHAFSALRISDCPALPSSRHTDEYLRKVDADQQQLHIYNCYIDTLEELKAAIDEKSKPLELAYSELVYGAGFIALLAALITFRELSACSIKEAYRALAGKDPDHKKSSEIERYLEKENIFRSRVCRS